MRRAILWTEMALRKTVAVADKPARYLRKGRADSIGKAQFLFVIGVVNLPKPICLPHQNACPQQPRSYTWVPKCTSSDRDQCFESKTSKTVHTRGTRIYNSYRYNVVWKAACHIPVFYVINKIYSNAD